MCYTHTHGIDRRAEYVCIDGKRSLLLEMLHTHTPIEHRDKGQVKVLMCVHINGKSFLLFEMLHTHRA